MYKLYNLILWYWSIGSALRKGVTVYRLLTVYGYIIICPRFWAPSPPPRSNDAFTSMFDFVQHLTMISTINLFDMNAVPKYHFVKHLPIRIL